MTDFTDNFSAGLNAAWTALSGFGTFGVVGGEAKGNSAGNNAMYVNLGFQTDQYAQILVGSSALGSHGVILRASAISTAHYRFWMRADGFQVVSYFDGVTENILASGTGLAPNTGDTIRGEATGTGLVLKLNGSTIQSASDATLASGFTGMYGNGASATFDNFLGGPLLSGTSPPLMGQAWL